MEAGGSRCGKGKRRGEDYFRLLLQGERLGTPPPEVEMNEDTERWIDAAAAKHR